jgi:5-methylcytosine-specific restriction endonuclease McrA
MPRKRIAKYLNPWMFRREKKRKRFEAIRARDGDNCWRCHHPMDFAAPSNSKRAPTIEHLQAKANGGTGKLDNLVLCHVGCNRHLGVNSPEQKERMRLRRGDRHDKSVQSEAARAAAEESR